MYILCVIKAKEIRVTFNLSQVFIGWGYNFVLKFIPDNSSTATAISGAEYFSVQDNIVRRDWIQGLMKYSNN